MATTSLATSAQLADFLYGDPTKTGQLPQDAARLLRRAGECVLDYTTAAVYPVDSAGNSTDSVISAALADATCAQVEFWLAGDEEDDVVGPLASVSSGGMNQDMGGLTDRVTPMYLGPRAARALRQAGLLSASVMGV